MKKVSEKLEFVSRSNNAEVTKQLEKLYEEYEKEQKI